MCNGTDAGLLRREPVGLMLFWLLCVPNHVELTPSGNAWLLMFLWSPGLYTEAHLPWCGQTERGESECEFCSVTQ